MEQVGAVFEIAVESVRLLQELDRQVELRALVIDLQELPGEPRAGGGWQGRREEPEIDLDQGKTARIAWGVQGLNELVERHQLVRQPFEDRCAHGGQRAAEIGIALQHGAQRQRVAEAAYQTFDLRQLAAGQGRTDGDILLAGIGGKQHLEGGE